MPAAAGIPHPNLRAAAPPRPSDQAIRTGQDDCGDTGLNSPNRLIRAKDRGDAAAPASPQTSVSRMPVSSSKVVSGEMIAKRSTGSPRCELGTTKPCWSSRSFADQAS